MEEKLRPIMLDPSLLCKVEFWEEIIYLNDFTLSALYIPVNIKQIEDPDFREFYGGYLPRQKIVGVDEVVRKSQLFKTFYWREYYEQIPEQLMGGFERLMGGLERSSLPKPIQQTLLDEFVFLISQSSLLSRLKKVFKLFEEFDAIPLLNLEKRVPEEWSKTVRGIKNIVSSVNWIASIGSFSLSLGLVVEGVRLFLIDPPLYTNKRSDNG